MFGIPKTVTQRVLVANIGPDRQAHRQRILTIGSLGQRGHARGNHADAAIQISKGVAKLNQIPGDAQRDIGEGGIGCPNMERDLNRWRRVEFDRCRCGQVCLNRGPLLKGRIRAIERILRNKYGWSFKPLPLRMKQ